MLSALNDEQRIAVQESGNVLLTACPGSGKTRALTYKIAYELEKLENSKKTILAVTFTNRAADEIKKRISSLASGDSNLWAGTIHAFCLEWILKPYMCYLENLRNGFSVADEYHTWKLIEDLKKEYGLKYWDTVSTRYKKSGELEEETHSDLIKEYHRLLREGKRIDFDQILYFSYKLLSEYKLIPEILKNLFHVICVDEYQDTQNLQYAILAEIMKADKGTCNMFIVGDADQAIYGSLGGVAKSKEEIETEFNVEFEQKELTGNYRSSQRIIDFYRNFQISDIDIVAVGTDKDKYGRITYRKDINEREIDTYIAEIIRSRIHSGVKEEEICVLAPTWYMIIPMGRRLKALLPEFNFDAVGLSPLQRNRENIWFRIARLFLVVPSPQRISTRKRWAKEIVDELENIGEGVLMEIDNKAKILLKVINSIKSDKVEGLDYLEECFGKFCDFFGIDPMANEYLKANWDTFFEGAKQRLSDPDLCIPSDIESFRNMFHHEKGIVVNTCHGIKGDEFNTVIAFGLLHGRLPNRNEQDINAANKLLYVICSRAKEELHLISETGRTYGKYKTPYLPTEQLNAVHYEYD